MNTMSKALGISLCVLLLWFIYYFCMPVMAYGFIGVPISLILLGIVIAYFISKTIGITISTIGAFILIVLAFFTTWSAFHADEYHQLIGEVKVSTFTQDIAPVDISHIRYVDQGVASRLGEKRLGENPALGSRASLGNFSIQKINGELYWVAPVEHSGFWKWKKFSNTPGYVKVSATNPRDIEYITEVSGEKINLRYQTGAYFSDNLERHLYMNGYMSLGLDDFSFEVRDDGVPFWVVTVYEKTIGYSGNNALGIVTVNPMNGEISKLYTPEEAPGWIDRIQPDSFVTTQLNDWGSYVNGWLNQTIFGAKEGILKATEGISLVFGKDGKSYWYTGISSIGKDGSTVGFVLVDTRSKKTHWYKQAGATEVQAQGSAKGKVQEKGYIASFPVLYNISGVPTYVMALKDNAGLIKMIAMVSVEDYGIVGVGNSMRDALRSYRSELSSKGNAIVPDGAVERFKISGQVQRIASDIRNGETFYYMMIDNVDDKLFVASSTLSNELPITKLSDIIQLEFMDAGGGTIDLSSFDNLNINLSVTQEQSEVTERFNNVQNRKVIIKDAQQDDSQWDDLSSDEKAEMLKLMKQGNK